MASDVPMCLKITAAFVIYLNTVLPFLCCLLSLGSVLESRWRNSFYLCRYSRGSYSEPSTKPDGAHSVVPAYVGERSLSWLHNVETRAAHTVMSSCLWTFSKLLLLFITKICRIYFYPLLYLFRNKISCSQASLFNWGRLQCLILLPLVLTLQVSLCDTGYGTQDFVDVRQALY